ncbi:hypothetical protein NHF50_01145 [Flavobacterium sp. NRK F10]|uniref:hypothetical protein n=1 Tax=Flavobacterium sp. NRK F10 TaxID=2954931 RepID=UPI00209018FD|nr:hypothetical protein [Flavobacterium sp. NRK F10]MCO6173642.1 hypothetical protein [Flavobacterium sp. NRK F10]
MTMTKFDTPAYQGEKDFQNQPDKLKEQFLASWSNYVNYCTINSQMGNPWTSLYDHPRSWYYDPLVTPVIPASSNTVPIQWTAFPNRINHYFQGLFSHTFGEDATDKLHELADIGPDAFSQKYNITLDVPANPCDPNNTQTKSFGPKGPRGWQDEYCEWSVTRDENGNITAVDFTHENPEYWFHLWRVSPDLVLSLYQEILSQPNIKLEDLYLYDANNNPVIVRETGKPAYNPINKWNSGSATTGLSGGAIHLTSPPNSLGAEIYLGAAATILRQVNGTILKDANQLICASQYGQIYRNSDPRIGQSVNLLVQDHDLLITLTNPIALYGQKPDLSMFEMPANANKTIQDCYTIVRGLENNSGKAYYPNNMILHSRFFVPEGANFTLSDIKINGVPMKWGSQIADTFQVQLAGTGIPASSGQKPEIFPPVADAPVLLPNIQYVLDYDVLSASLYNKLNSLSNLTSCITQVEVGKTTDNIAILTYNATKNTQFDFGPGITTTINSYQDLGNNGQLFVVSLEVDSSASTGQKPLALYNTSTDPKYPIAGVLEVVPAGTLPTLSTKKNATALSEAQVEHLKAIL